MVKDWRGQDERSQSEGADVKTGAIVRGVDGDVVRCGKSMV